MGKHEEDQVQDEQVQDEAGVSDSVVVDDRPVWDVTTQGDPPDGEAGEQYRVIDSHTATAEADQEALKEGRQPGMNADLY